MLGGIVLFISIMYLFIMFWLFSILGWLLEVIVFIICDKKFVNRGFLIGPYCPIYGCGALIMLAISELTDNMFVFFVLAMVLCSVLEYFTSFIMESLFGIRWWDYSNDAFNINGRVCLRNALAFGALGIIFIRFLKPLYDTLINSINYNIMFTITIIIFIITIIDLLVSFNSMSSIKMIIGNGIGHLKNKDATEDVKKIMTNKVLKTNFIQERLIKTYHLLDKEKEYLKKTIKKVNEKTKSGYGLLLLFIIIGIIIGLILSVYFKLASVKVIVPFTVSISSLIAVIIMRVGDK